MKAPDKIYMPNELLSEEWCRHIERQDTEYIRKDALLEWLDKEKLEELKPLLDTDPYREAYIGKCEAFKEVIDKLNEM